MTPPTPTTPLDRARIRLVQSLLDEGDNGEKVVVSAHIFTADTVPTEAEVQDFWQRHCKELDYETVKGLLKDLLLQKRSVGV
jgi:hypothetical protein